MGGYKAMLRDRMPATVDLALKYCKAKTAYVDYLYDEYISNVSSKERKSRLVKELLGLKKAYDLDTVISTFRMFGRIQTKEIPNDSLYLTFRETFDWAKLALGDPDVFKYWKSVADWVDWFKKQYSYIENTFKTSQMTGKTEDECKSEIIRRYSLNENLANYLKNSFNDE